MPSVLSLCLYLICLAVLRISRSSLRHSNLSSAPSLSAIQEVHSIPPFSSCSLIQVFWPSVLHSSNALPNGAALQSTLLSFCFFSFFVIFSCLFFCLLLVAASQLCAFCPFILHSCCDLSPLNLKWVLLLCAHPLIRFFSICVYNIA